MAFIEVASVDDLSIGEKQNYTVAEQKILLIRLDDGFYATQAKCPHLSAPLVKGKLIDGNTRIQCKFHRAEFDIKTGKACKWACFPPGIQALNFIRGEKDLTTYPTKIEDNKVFVSIGA